MNSLRLAGRALVGELEAAAGLLDQRGDRVGQAAGQDQPAVEGLVVAAQEPRRVPGGEPPPLPFVEGRVRHRRGVLERGEQRRGQLARLDPDAAASRAWTTGGGGTRIRVEVAVPSRSTLAPTATWPGAAREPADLARAHPAQGGQVGPLVLVRFQRGQVEEDRGAVPAGRPCSGAAIRLPSPPAGSTSWEGNSRS